MNIAIAGTTLGLIVGNFAYQALTGAQWGIAMERSFFQLVAIITIWSVIAIRRNRIHD